jgi:hypothetical protein
LGLNSRAAVGARHVVLAIEQAHSTLRGSVSAHCSGKGLIGNK